MRHVLWGVALWLGLAGLALAEPRLALVIGNGAYAGAAVPGGGPGDARLMAEALKVAGFDVAEVQDADRAAMVLALGSFARALADAGPAATGLFYFSGLAVQRAGQNYLLPVDAAPKGAADPASLGVEAQGLVSRIAAAGNRVLVILDAGSVPEGGTGLAEMAAPEGGFMAFAAAPGALGQADAAGASLFTRALAARLVTPGAAIEDMFRDVRVDVLQATGGQQSLWEANSLTGDFTFMERAAAPDVESLWADASLTQDPVRIMLFLRTHPNSAHEAEARALLVQVMQVAVGGQTAPANAVPADAVPADTVTANAVPANTVPANAVPADAVPADTVAADTVTADTVPAAMVAAIAAAAVSFQSPLTEGDGAIKGRSIEALIATGPLFSPVEGLPKEAWQGQHCTACHKWTRAALCDQARFYVKEAAASASLSQHPLGGAFKLTLKAWGQAGCP